MNTFTSINEHNVRSGDFSGGAFAYYRLPGTDHYTFISQQGRPKELAALDISDTFRGFVIAPFVISKESPLILLEPDFTTKLPVPDTKAESTTHVMPQNDDSLRRKAYTHSFEAMHRRLMEGKAGKIVLSRRMALCNPTSAQLWKPTTFFREACRKYPHHYVCLWWTQRTGCWLIASPETLLKKVDDKQWQTMALAGTMNWNECKDKDIASAWSLKNIEEQQYVATYIERQLFPHVRQLSTSPTYSSRAAELAHLRTDFTFQIQENASLGLLLKCLHPTPAVCGVPQDTALQAILEDEDSPRKYYAGFSGPVNWQDESQLYVSLRCMEIDSQKALLYAGGGLLKESHEEEEWAETQKKMRTMLKLFR